MNLNLVQASNRSGEAVRASVTFLRTAGSSVLKVDSLTNWPANFIATTGKLLTDNTIDPASVLVFTGHKSGADIAIDSIAPGYTDAGNSVADIVVIKPTTLWADNLADFLGTSLNNDGTMKTSAVQTALQSANILTWYPLTTTPGTVTALGNHSYSVVMSGDQTGILSPGMRLQTTRTVAAPNQCASLNGTNQYFNKVSPAGMTFTVTCTAMGARKLNAYSVQWFGGRTTGTSGFRYGINANGQLVFEVQPGNATTKTVTSYQSVPLNKWFRFAFQIDLAGTCQIMLDGIAIPSVTAGTATSLTQAGDWQVGAANGAGFTNGKIAQDALFSAKLTDNTVRSYESQTFSGSETSLISAYSFSNSLADLNTTNANNLTANNAATTTNADSPFGGQAGGTISTTKDYGIIQSISYSSPNTTAIVQVPEGCTIPTSGGLSAISYSGVKAPYGFPPQKSKWEVLTLWLASISLNTTSGTWSSGVTNGTLAINAPLGEWAARYDMLTYGDNGAAAAGERWATLSTSNSSESDPRNTTYIKITPGPGTTFLAATMQRSDIPLSLSAATPYYVVVKSVGANGNNQINVIPPSGSMVILSNALL